MTTNNKTKINNYPNVISFRLDQAAFASLTEAAAARGMTPNVYARHLTTSSASIQAKLPETKVRSVAANELAVLKIELVRQGTNLNQIARAVHQGDHSSLALMPDWFRQSSELLHMIADCLGTTRDP